MPSKIRLDEPPAYQHGSFTVEVACYPVFHWKVEDLSAGEADLLLTRIRGAAERAMVTIHEKRKPKQRRRRQHAIVKSAKNTARR